jgi:uncharacterized protein (TIGR03437 family)
VLGSKFIAPNLYVSPTRLDVFVPYETIGVFTAPTTMAVDVSTTNGASRYMIELRSLTPSLFAAVNLDGIPVGILQGARPAKPDTYISLFGSGFGQTVPAVTTTTAITKPLPLLHPVSVTIGGIPAEVVYSGLVSFGLYQLNVKVPATLNDGQYEVSVNVNGITSEGNIVIPIRH